MTVVTQTVWRTLGAEWIETKDDPATGTIAVQLQAGGESYAVVVSGPKNMHANNIIGALRASAAALLRACGGDMATVGASDLKDPTFDTGDQRAN